MAQTEPGRLTITLHKILMDVGIKGMSCSRNGLYTKTQTQDERTLRRCKRRWKVERLFAWLGNFRRLVVRYEHRAQNYLGFVRLARTVILLRHL